MAHTQAKEVGASPPTATATATSTATQRWALVTGPARRGNPTTTPAGRFSRADKARLFAIARGETVEAVAAVEIAALSGEADAEAAARCLPIADRLVALLTGFIR